MGVGGALNYYISTQRDWKKEEVKNFEEIKKTYLKDYKALTVLLKNNRFNTLVNDLRHSYELKKEDFGNFAKKYKGRTEFDDPKKIVVEYACEQIISENLTQTFDIFDYIKNKCKELQIQDDDWKDAVDRFQKEFEDNLSYIIYDISSKYLRSAGDDVLDAIHWNIAFKSECQPNIFTFILTEQSLTLDKKIIWSLSEAIANSQKIQAVNLIFIPRDMKGEIADNLGLDGLMYSNLLSLISGVSRNRNIKSFFLHSVKDYDLVIPPEICQLIVKKLQSETLVAFHLGNFLFSPAFKKKLRFQISSTRSLLFFSFEDHEFLADDFNNLRIAIEKNHSIIAICISCPDFKGMREDKILEKKRKLMGNSEIKAVYIGHESLFKYIAK